MCISEYHYILWSYRLQ